MDFIVKEDEQTKNLEKIFDENQKSNVFDKTALHSNEFIRLVCFFRTIPIGYVAIYPFPNFMEKEGVAAKFTPEKNAVYIWHIAVKKAFEGKGVASLLIDEVLVKYKNRPIYSVMEEMNTPAIMIHTRAGFKAFAKFKRKFGNEIVNLILMKRSGN
jgi:ribosomal protein S18 acetylase RimI-like enzyme